MTIILSNLIRFTIFSKEDSTANLQENGYKQAHHSLNMLPHYIVKQWCQQRQAIYDKLQGSVATYLKCGGVVNNQIKTDLLLSLSVKNF